MYEWAKINEEDTTSSGRIFVKIVMGETMYGVEDPCREVQRRGSQEELWRYVPDGCAEEYTARNQLFHQYWVGSRHGRNAALPPKSLWRNGERCSKQSLRRHPILLTLTRTHLTP